MENLKHYFDKDDWLFRGMFDNGRDEILLIIPYEMNIQAIFESLYAVLAVLPDITYSPERAFIGFCYPDGSGYCSRLINPNKQDEIHLALLGQLPSRRISEAELK